MEPKTIGRDREAEKASGTADQTPSGIQVNLS